MKVSKTQYLLTGTVIAVVGLCRTADAGEISAKAISVTETRSQDYINKPENPHYCFRVQTGCT